MESRVVDVVTSVAPNTISARRIAHRLEMKKSIVNAVLYTDPQFKRHIKTPTSHTDPHITWSLGEDTEKSKPARHAVNSRNKASKKRAMYELKEKMRQHAED
jgi:hypothetical protein